MIRWVSAHPGSVVRAIPVYPPSVCHLHCGVKHVFKDPLLNISIAHHVRRGAHFKRAAVVRVIHVPKKGHSVISMRTYAPAHTDAHPPVQMHVCQHCPSALLHYNCVCDEDILAALSSMMPRHSNTFRVGQVCCPHLLVIKALRLPIHADGVVCKRGVVPPHEILRTGHHLLVHNLCGAQCEV